MTKMKKTIQIIAILYLVSFLDQAYSKDRLNAQDEIYSKLTTQQCQEVNVHQLLLNPLPYDGKVVCGYARLFHLSHTIGLKGLNAQKGADMFEKIIELNYSSKDASLLRSYDSGYKVYFYGKLELHKGCWGLDDELEEDEVWECAPNKKPIDISSVIIFILSHN